MPCAALGEFFFFCCPLAYVSSLTHWESMKKKTFLGACFSRSKSLWLWSWGATRNAREPLCCAACPPWLLVGSRCLFFMLLGVCLPQVGLGRVPCSNHCSALHKPCHPSWLLHLLELCLGWPSLAKSPSLLWGLKALRCPLLLPTVLCPVSCGITDTSLSILSVSLQPLLGKACL